ITTTKNGEFIDEKCVTLDLEPGQTCQLEYDVVQKRYKDEEYIVTFTVKEKNETMYAPKGHEIKHHQVVLKPNALKIEKEENANTVNIDEEDKLITLSTEKVKVSLSKESGLLCEYIVNNKNILKEELKAYFWRSSTNNDRGFKNKINAVSWRNKKKKYKLITLSTEKVKVLLSKEICIVCKYIVNNKNILKEELKPYFWRSSTNNDRGFKNEINAVSWRNPEMNLVNIKIENYSKL